MGSLENIHPDIPHQLLDGTWPRSNERGYTIDERPAFSPSHKRIIGIGAGLAGIALAMKVNERSEHFNLQIFEKAPNVGGNWFWNQYVDRKLSANEVTLTLSGYPGLACDNPGVTYQYIKDTIPDWPDFYSKGGDIRDYMQGVVKKNDLGKYFRLQTEVVRAEWSDAKSQWYVTVKSLETGAVATERADVVVSCTGPLHHPKWPDLKNAPLYKGVYVHASRYPDKLELKDKRVAVLGTGASGVQIVPAIIDQAAKVYHWIRQPTYILPLDASRAPFKYSPETLQRFANDPSYYLKYRKALEHRGNNLTASLIQGTDESKHTTQLCLDNMREKLASRPDILEKLTPKNWDFGCRRPTPAPGYLESLCNDKVHVLFGGLREMTEKGFFDENGQEHEVDIFICATGYDTSYVPHFPIISRGVNLQEKWSNADPDAYLSLASPGFPNYFITSGPWAGAAHGSAFPIAELMVEAFLDWIQKMAREQISSMEVTQEATDDFLEHASLWLKRSVLVQPCKSWWKASKSGLPLLFPGSRAMLIEMATTLRPEDWKFRYASGNRFRCMGNGFHPMEVNNNDDTFYLGLIDGKTTMPDYGSIIEENSPYSQPAKLK